MTTAALERRRQFPQTTNATRLTTPRKLLKQTHTLEQIRTIPTHTCDRRAAPCRSLNRPGYSAHSTPYTAPGARRCRPRPDDTQFTQRHPLHTRRVISTSRSPLRRSVTQPRNQHGLFIRWRKAKTIGCTSNPPRNRFIMRERGNGRMSGEGNCTNGEAGFQERVRIERSRGITRSANANLTSGARAKGKKLNPSFI